MLDDLRKQADNSYFDDPDDADTGFERPRSPRRFLGMTPAQTFFISMLLFILTCLLSSACLLATGRVVPPFL